MEGCTANRREVKPRTLDTRKQAARFDTWAKRCAMRHGDNVRQAMKPRSERLRRNGRKNGGGVSSTGATFPQIQTQTERETVLTFHQNFFCFLGEGGKLSPHSTTPKRE